MTLSDTVGEGIIYVAIIGGTFYCLPGLLELYTSLNKTDIYFIMFISVYHH